MEQTEAPTAGIAQGPAAPAYDTCCVKIEADGNRPCGAIVVYLTREAALTCLRGLYSGWYHADTEHDHHAVPKKWVS